MGSPRPLFSARVYPVVSRMNGTASTRKPSTPSCVQKPMIRPISSRTAGLAMLRSGWNR